MFGCQLGADASGRTTMLYQMKLGEKIVTVRCRSVPTALCVVVLANEVVSELHVFRLSCTQVPTIGFNIETVEHKGTKLTLWDVGGCDRIRPLWRHYFAGTQVVFFFVDCADRARLNEVCLGHRVAALAWVHQPATCFPAP